MGKPLSSNKKNPPPARGAAPAVTGVAAAGDVPVAAIKTLVLVVLTGLGIYLCWRLAQPFLEAFTWALGLAVLFAPLQRWLEPRLKRPSLAAFVAVLVISLMVLVPAVFVGQRLVLQAAEGAKMVESKITSGEWREVLEAKARMVPIFAQFEKNFDLPGLVTTVSGWLSTAAGAILQGSIYQILGFGLTLYLLFFMLRDREAALRSMRELSPLADHEAERLFHRIGETIRATLNGTLVVSAAQGVLGGLMFWWLGLPTPLLWGLVMAVLSVVPVLGAFIVWLPAALFLASEGSWGKALILGLWGMFVVGTVDNLLRPVLVGKKLDQHTLLSFLSVIGGLLLFGPSGLILGPVTLTFTLTLLELWADRARAGTVGEPGESLAAGPEKPL